MWFGRHGNTGWFAQDLGGYIECYASLSGSRTLHFSFNAFGICRSFPSFVIFPFHVRTPLARPCNPFTVNSNQRTSNVE